jgi:hypothetical protein
LVAVDGTCNLFSATDKEQPDHSAHAMVTVALLPRNTASSTTTLTTANTCATFATVFFDRDK